MEGNRVCQICNRRFSNGKAMGGHMRSHFAKLLLPTPTHNSTPSSFHPLNQSHPRCLPFVRDFDLPSHDRLESNDGKFRDGNHETNDKRGRGSPEEAVESPAESEQVSLSSDITFSDEEGAMCLLMLSRDAWPSVEREAGESRGDVDSDDRDDDDEPIIRIRARTRNKGRFKCETCNKLFGSYQALGGHMAGHKKVKLHKKKHDVPEDDGGGEKYYFAGNGYKDDGCSQTQKIFECPYCGKVFESGQALGGHKKVHVQLSGSSHNCSASSSKGKVTGKHRRSSLIDLNQLPDPETNNEELKSINCIKRRIF